MTALTRLLFGFNSVEHELDIRILIVSGAISLLAVAVLIIRYGSNQFPVADEFTAYDK